MTPVTRVRALDMLRRRLITNRDKNMHPRHVYVVGKKLFLFRYAAEQWAAEVWDKTIPVEVVSIEEAYTSDELNQISITNN